MGFDIFWTFRLVYSSFLMERDPWSLMAFLVLLRKFYSNVLRLFTNVLPFKNNLWYAFNLSEPIGSCKLSVDLWIPKAPFASHLFFLTLLSTLFEEIKYRTCTNLVKCTVEL